MEIKIQNKTLNTGRESLSLLSGEFHYWRVPEESWSRIMMSIREMGLDTITSYIPWHYHEKEKGKFDFTLLENFLDLLEKENFWVVLRPGPYLYTEWQNKGVPDYMVKYHRLHPEFLKLSAEYIKNICAVIKPYLVTKGGNVVMVQADNESDPWTRYYEKGMGYLSEPGLFQDFLKNKYGSIEKLNLLWETSYSSFNEARPVAENIKTEKKYIIRYIDTKDFIHDFTLKAASWAINEYKKNGIDVPVSHNVYPDVAVQNWRRLQEKADVLGIDTYPVHEFRGDTSDNRVFMDQIRYLSSFAEIPYIAEFESGVWQGAHYDLGIPSPNHYRLICVSALQAGASSWNWYMLVNRDNWYMCPINERGKKRGELFPVFQNIVSVFNDVKPWRCELMTDAAATFDTLQTAAFGFKDNPVLEALYDADADFTFYDVDSGAPEKKILFYAGKDFLSKKGQENIVKYAENGGVVVFFQTLPLKDEKLQDFNLPNIMEPVSIIEEHRIELKLGDLKCVLTSPIFTYNSSSCEEIIAVRQFPEKPVMEEEACFENLMLEHAYNVGYIRSIKKGKIIVLGVKPCADLIKTVMKYAGVDNFSESSVPKIKSSVIRNDKDFYIAVSNNGNEKAASFVKLNESIMNGKKKYAFDLFNLQKLEINKSGITVNVDAKDATIVKISEN